MISPKYDLSPRKESTSNLFPEATIERMAWSNKSLTTHFTFEELLSITEQQVSYKKIVKDKTEKCLLY